MKTVRTAPPAPLVAASALGIAVLLVSIPAAPEGIAPLWGRAVEVFEANKNLVPGSMAQTMEELDDKGTVKSLSETRFRFVPGGPDGVETEIVSSIKDGKDVTAKERAELAERQEKERKKKDKERKDTEKKDENRSHSVSSNDSPFSADVQKDIRVSDTGRREDVDGRRCAVFEFSYPRRDPEDTKSKPHAVKGTAWIDEETGNPLRVDSTRDPLPRGAKRMSSTFLYAARADGSLVLAEMRFEGEGGFLFISKRFRMKMTFADHWLHEEPAAGE